MGLCLRWSRNCLRRRRGWFLTDRAVESMTQHTEATGHDAPYPNLDFTPRELRDAMRAAYDELIAFVTSKAFDRFYRALMALPPRDRPAFVARGLFSEEGLREWQIVIPDGVVIQTSAFGDRRPTLFAVKKMMPDRFHCVWENMNLTFNNEFKEVDVPTDAASAWRAPLPVSLQNSLIAKAVDLQSVPEHEGIQFGMYEPRKCH